MALTNILLRVIRIIFVNISGFILLFALGMFFFSFSGDEMNPREPILTVIDSRHLNQFHAAAFPVALTFLFFGLAVLRAGLPFKNKRKWIFSTAIHSTIAVALFVFCHIVPLGPNTP
jgi:hypothetical protein